MTCTHHYEGYSFLKDKFFVGNLATELTKWRPLNEEMDGLGYCQTVTIIEVEGTVRQTFFPKKVHSGQ